MLEDLVSERRKKLEKLKQAGIDPYPLRAKRTALIVDDHRELAENIHEILEAGLATHDLNR